MAGYIECSAVIYGRLKITHPLSVEMLYTKRADSVI